MSVYASLWNSSLVLDLLFHNVNCQNLITCIVGMNPLVCAVFLVSLNCAMMVEPEFCVSCILFAYLFCIAGTCSSPCTRTVPCRAQQAGLEKTYLCSPPLRGPKLIKPTLEETHEAGGDCRGDGKRGGGGGLGKRAKTCGAGRTTAPRL